MKSLKNNFIVKNAKTNLISNKNENMKNTIKIKLPKYESMYDKINNHFKSIDFEKLKLLGEDNSNYGNFIFQGYVYKPKKIKVEYLGSKDINNDLPIKSQLIEDNLSIYKSKKKNISFINPINYSKVKNNNYAFDISNKNNFTTLDINLPMIPKIKHSHNEENKNHNRSGIINGSKKESEKKIHNNKRSINNLNGSKSYSIIKNISKNENSGNNSKIKYSKNNDNFKYHPNISAKLLKKINIHNLKGQLKNRRDLLENKVNNSSKFILNGSKINEEEKPQFKLRFNNLSYHFKRYLD